MTRQLLTYPHPKLKEEVLEVEDPQRWKDLIEEMETVIRRHDGLGLAAPQVGVSRAIFLLCLDAEKGLYETYVNPEILSVDDRRSVPEGCLSFPDVSVEIERGLRVSFGAHTPAGHEVERTVEGIQAQCVQHEVDHLRGRTLLDHCDLQKKMEIHSRLEEPSPVEDS